MPSGEGSRDNFRFVKEMTDAIVKDDAFMHQQNSAVYFKLSGYMMKVIFDDNRQTYFIGCPECKKKLNSDGSNYRCENCDKSFNEKDAKVTYTLVAKF